MNWPALRFAFGIVSAIISLVALIYGLFVGWLLLAIRAEGHPALQSFVIALLPIAGIVSLLSIGVSAYRTKVRRP